MAMLAEPKRKQKFSLNPRGKAWSQDPNKFGQKMLEKMGWSHGKGLGPNENGILEHVKVSHKNDSKGIGYKESGDQWTEHESNFSALLEALGGGEQKSNDIKLNSLEEKSQNSRARVHYRKFTRGKDISRYSDKDLANIFGKKSLKELTNSKKELQEVILDSVKEENDGQVIEKSHLFSHGGLISDYFKKKLGNFGKTNGYVVGNNGVLKKANDSESESELRVTFGFGFNQEVRTKETLEEEGNETFVISNKEDNKVETNFTSYIYNNIENNSKRKKNKKKRNYDENPEVIDFTPTKKKKLESNKVHETTPIKKKKIKPGEVREDTPIKKKKEKSKKKQEIDQWGLSNPGFDPLCSPIKVEKHILEPIEESPSESLQTTLNDTIGQVAENFEVKVQINNETTPVRMGSQGNVENDGTVRKKKKKDKTEKMEISYQSEEILDQTVGHIKERKNKKVKKFEDIEQESTSSSNINYIFLTEEDCNNSTLKKEKKRKKIENNILESHDVLPNAGKEKSAKKKKSKTITCQEGLDNPLFNISIGEEESTAPPTENPYEIKINRKKKTRKSKEGKENYALENPVFNGDDSVNSQDLTNEAFEIKRKDKSKKKRQGKEKGLDNPALNLSDTIEESCDLMLNVVTTPIIPKEEKSALDESSSIQKVASVKRRKSVRFSDVTRERFIPNKDEIEDEVLDNSRDIVEVEGKLNDSSDFTYRDKFIQRERKKAKKRKQGMDNSGFDQQATTMEEKITSISKTLDNYQAEIENDMNEEKLKSVGIEDIMVGEVGNPDGPDEILPDGTVKLKFKSAKFSKSARFIDGLTGAKKSYKHLIKGDIVMNFKETNLHEVAGYAVKVN